MLSVYFDSLWYLFHILAIIILVTSFLKLNFLLLAFPGVWNASFPSSAVFLQNFMWSS